MEAWVIKFDDADVNDFVFCGEGAEQAAKETFKQRSQSWNCHLFGPAERIAELEEAVEEMRVFAVYGCGTKQKDARGRQFSAIIDIAAKVQR